MKKSDDDHEILSRHVSKNDDMALLMADLALDSLKEEYKIEWEPYELYALRLHSYVQSHPEQFRENFKKGYEVLLEKVKREG